MLLVRQYPPPTWRTQHLHRIDKLSLGASPPSHRNHASRASETPCARSSCSSFSVMPVQQESKVIATPFTILRSDRMDGSFVIWHFANQHHYIQPSLHCNHSLSEPAQPAGISVHLDSTSQDSLHERFPGAKAADLRRVVLQSAPSSEVHNAYKPLFGSETRVAIKGVFFT
jgi:hypothetical protein